jgi:A/G-specific adenine glycosylase
MRKRPMKLRSPMFSKACAARTVDDPSRAKPADGRARDQKLRKGLVAWFDRAARDLPWRRDRSPYSVWVSEIMLQQTRVDTVVPYYTRFLDRFANTSALANASLDDVLCVWSGLGYYRRARELHATAREVVERYGGVLPTEVSELRKLPGIGRYTAGAIASIAYGKREPLVDGNVARVLARLEGIAGPINSAPVVRQLWATATKLLPAQRAGKVNEALMELGALVCTPREPRCDVCPLATLCAARSTGRERELPVKAPKRDVPEVLLVSLVVRDAEGRILFMKQTDSAAYGGLWGPPTVAAATLPAGIDKLRAMGVHAADLAVCGVTKHVLSHRRLRVTVVRATSAPSSGPGVPTAFQWFDPRAPVLVGTSTLCRKVLALAENG